MIKSKIWMFYILLLIQVVSCGKKKTESEETQTEPEAAITNEFPIVPGRNLDSLKNQEYRDRILAFSIELGHRSNDFNRRFAMMLRASSGGDWRTAIKNVLESENYKAAENYNIAYLDSLSQLISKPVAVYKEHQVSLAGSYDRLKNNYALIRNYPSFKNMPAILDTVLSDEFVIKGSLKNFEEFMRTISNKKLPN
jgi:hypothetical protein